MPRDFFRKNETSKEKLFKWMKEKQYIKTSEVLRFGVDHYSNRADRDARQLAKEGKIQRMPKEKVELFWGNIKQEVWEVK